MSQDLRQLPESNLIRELFEHFRPQLPPENELSIDEKVVAEKRRLAGDFDSVGTTS
jgi:hypothetical protein